MRRYKRYIRGGTKGRGGSEGRGGTEGREVTETRIEVQMRGKVHKIGEVPKGGTIQIQKVSVHRREEVYCVIYMSVHVCLYEYVFDYMYTE